MSFKEGIAEYGGAVYTGTIHDVLLEHCTFRSCQAKYLAAAVYFKFQKLGQRVEDCQCIDCDPPENVFLIYYNQEEGCRMIIGKPDKVIIIKEIMADAKASLYFEEEEFKIYYASMIHLRKNQSMSPEQNYELERLLHHGLDLNAGQMARVLKKGSESSEVLDYLYSHTDLGMKRYLLMLDLYNISSEEELSRQETDNLWLFAHMLEIPEKYMMLFEHFIRGARKENEGECRRIFAMMTECKNRIVPDGVKILSYDPV